MKDQCESRYVSGVGNDLPPLWRADNRRCQHEKGHEGPHWCLLHHTWTDEPAKED